MSIFTSILEKLGLRKEKKETVAPAAAPKVEAAKPVAPAVVNKPAAPVAAKPAASGPGVAPDLAWQARYARARRWTGTDARVRDRWSPPRAFHPVRPRPSDVLPRRRLRA